jgi:hypothetical protein
MIKILTGWSNAGGSTEMFIRLTNELNKKGHDTTLYGPHDWHLDKCKSGKLDNTLKINKDDQIISHFLQLGNRPDAKRVILSCHEKDLFKVGEVKQYWDEVVFLNEVHREYHNQYKNDFTIIPNLKGNLVQGDKTGLEKIAGIIGSFDLNKQTHISIKRAIDDGCEKVYLFGEPNTPYFNQYVEPFCDKDIIVKGFVSDKQAMYDSIGVAYLSSISEVAPLVKDECEQTGTIFKGNDNTNYAVNNFTNDEIIDKWLKVLEV